MVLKSLFTSLFQMNQDNEHTYPLHKIHSTIRCVESILDLDFSALNLYRQNISDLKAYIETMTPVVQDDSDSTPELLEEKQRYEKEIQEKDLYIKSLIERLRYLQLSLDFMEAEKE